MRGGQQNECGKQAVLPQNVRRQREEYPPTSVTGYQCKAFYKAAKARVAPSTAESYMFTLRSFFNWCVKENLC